MNARSPLALLAAVVAFAAVAHAPAFGQDPTPAPAPASSTAVVATPQVSPAPVSPLTPLNLNATPDPTSTGPYPRLLGHIIASASCIRFVDHYNVAATLMTANDARIVSVDTALNQIADDYYRRDGALRAYDHRLTLIDNVSQMLKTIPAEQGAINDLLAQAKQTKSPTRQAALQESASQLQKSVDRQRSLAYDLSNVVHVLMDKHGSEDTFATRISIGLLPGQTFNLNPGDNPVPQPGDGPLLTRSAPPKNQTTAQDVLQYDRQKSIIGTAETKAASAATRVVTTCVQESDGTPAGQSQPAPSPSP
ncbi:MAG TPA: hypothetical protein VID19_01385 [Candidatus Eremiobacteraceae bacterium]